MSDRITYLNAAETAKLVRAALKKAFPGVKFGVTSRSYAGGASINVKWVDGPKTKDVDAVVGVYAGGGFDGMIDLKYYVEAWLLPDGSAAFAGSQGTAGSMGVYEAFQNEAPAPGAKRVQFGADYIFTNRSASVEAYTAAVAKVCADWDIEMPPLVEGFGGLYIPDAWRIQVPGANDDLQRLINRQLWEM